MGWWTDGEGARGFFSDDQNIPSGWVRAADPNVVPIQPDPLDHDGNGKKGGSKAGAEATARKPAKAKARKR